MSIPTVTTITSSLAASVELNSEHSIAKAIVTEAKRRKIRFGSAKNFKAYPGKGAQANVGKSRVVVGNMAMIEESSIKSPKAKLKVSNDEDTSVYVAKDGRVLGAIFLEDEIRKESKGAIGALHSLGIKVAMLTGDKEKVARKVGGKLGIDTVFAEVLPQDKTNKVRQLQEKGHVVAMVGDGVNDAPSLTQAHVGIAIGAGTSVAIESAEIVLVKSNPMDIVKVMMKQNLAWATGYNTLAIPAAAGVFIPWGIMLRPEWGALLMSASSIIVVANALRLKKLSL